MKPSLIFTLLSCAVVVAPEPHASLDGSQSRLIEASDDVPGDNPLVYCADPKDYILDIDYVNLKPNPPEPGKNLTIEAKGTLSEDVEAGTKFFLTVKYNAITILKQEAELCDQLPSVNISCPVQKGPLNISQEVEITSQVPEGKYTVTADVYTEGHKEVITCLQGTAVFT